MAFDYRSRSLGLEVSVPAGRVLDAVELRDEDATTRLTESDYRVFTSADNDHYTELTGWTFTTRVDSGRLVHRFEGLGATDRYLKIAQSKADGAFTFVLADARDDVAVEFASRACDTTISGPHPGPLALDGGVVCVDGATVAGAVDVAAGTIVSITDSSISGPVTADGAGAVSLCGSRVSGPVAISGTSGLVQVGDPGEGCSGNVMAGGLSVTGGGAVRIAGTTISGPLACAGNDPAPVGVGRSNSVSGPCTGL